MRLPKYPLEPLAKLRERRVDEATRELAGAVQAREDAEAARVRAEQEERARREENARERAAARASLENGELRALDLMREHAWELRARGEEAALARTTQDARAGARRADQHQAEKRADLAVREGEAKVVENDRARWEARGRARVEARDEEASADAWRGPRGQR